MHKHIYIFQYRHQAREAEPKDYDISLAPTRDLHKATYQSFGNATNKVSAKYIWLPLTI